MQVNVKDGKKVIKPTQAELNALKRATEVAESAALIGLTDVASEVIEANKKLVAALNNAEAETPEPGNDGPQE